jgi:hypothetical protein
MLRLPISSLSKQTTSVSVAEAALIRIFWHGDACQKGERSRRL